MIYQYEWDRTGKLLSRSGKRHVEGLASRMAQAPCPVLIEPQGDAELDEARRQAVIFTLAGKGIDDADQRVRVEYSDAEALYGQTAPLIAFGYLRSSASMMGGGGGGGGGLGGGVAWVVVEWAVAGWEAAVAVVVAWAAAWACSKKLEVRNSKFE